MLVFLSEKNGRKHIVIFKRPQECYHRNGTVIHRLTSTTATTKDYERNKKTS